ncbi:MAG: hypothetical protein AAGN35_15325 [Bacteroidota bacterium]
MRNYGWLIHSQPYRLNILGVRSNSTRPNSFDDTIHVFYTDERGRWRLHSWRCTTDPGTYWLHSPMHPQGTAILKTGQYHSYGVAKHRGKYWALCQIKGKVTVVRDYNRDSNLDFRNGREMEGHFGINIHRASSYGTTKEVERYSAGCQVFANATDFEAFMRLCEGHRQRYGNAFTYSLLDLRSVRRAKARKVAGWVALGVGIGALGVLGYAWYNVKPDKQ